jgi:hypothetical protein
VSPKASLYTSIDVHSDSDGWPQDIPALTEAEASRAARRLWRFSLGTTFTGTVKVTSGRRYNRIGWDGNTRCIFVNPERGWKHFVHELSHWFDHLANGRSTHSKHHARFEAKLVREVIQRGWLDGKLRDAVKVIPIADAKLLDKRRKLEALRARTARWQTKLKRAENALAKLAKEERRCEREIAKAAGGAS